MWALIACGSETTPPGPTPGYVAPTGTAAAPATGTAGAATAGKAAGGTAAPAPGSVAGQPALTGSAGGTVTPVTTTGGTAGAVTTGTAGGTAAGSGTVGSTAGTTSTTAGSGGASGTVTAGTGGDLPGTGESSCLDGITNYDSAGPFKYATKTIGEIKFWVPDVPAGCKVPVVHLANGTTATCSSYQGALERLASHGFLTCCYESPNTGAGAQGLMAFDTALTMFPDLAANKLGSTGHSQGGQASCVVTQLAEQKWGDKMTYATLAMEPASGYGRQPSGQTWQQSYGKIKSPVFMFSGDSATGFSSSALLGQTTGDGLVAISWVNEGFEALSKDIEAYHWTGVGATHIPTPVPEEQQISIPWFRWKLLSDKAACEFFKKMPDAGKWKVQKEQNAKPCE